jgi:enamine deaminase RidA (YjgF/YER057c/UK114 family)
MNGAPLSWLPISILLATTLAQSQPVPAVRLRSIEADAATGVARAVVVEEGALVHTALMFPENRAGELQGPGNAEAQGAAVLANLEHALREARTTLDRLVRLHVYVADASVTARIDHLLAERFRKAQTKPAVTFVETAMPRAEMLVAMDAVAATGWVPDPGPATRVVSPLLRRVTPNASHAAIQRPGPFVVVSGRAAAGEFEAAIRGTLAQLRADLERAGLDFERVVQIKSFVGDISRAQRLQEIVAEAFPGAIVPPQVVMESRQGAEPAEIELVASVPRSAESRTGLEHLEPILGRYSRVARVFSGKPVFISGLYGTAQDPAAQVDEMFAQLQRLLQKTGSDVRHLVKATYYVSDKAADDRINALRPTIYDPEHPPAASKLMVRGTGRTGRASTFDMIAVTASR